MQNKSKKIECSPHPEPFFLNFAGLVNQNKCRYSWCAKGVSFYPDSAFAACANTIDTPPPSQSQLFVSPLTVIILCRICRLTWPAWRKRVCYVPQAQPKILLLSPPPPLLLLVWLAVKVGQLTPQVPFSPTQYFF
jgi:hypothetical protein